jgi:hypothetical protein
MDKYVYISNFFSVKCNIVSRSRLSDGPMGEVTQVRVYSSVV